eukprot:2045087-Pleurochrysis_carterae.AAC.1
MYAHARTQTQARTRSADGRLERFEGHSRLTSRQIPLVFSSGSAGQVYGRWPRLTSFSRFLNCHTRAGYGAAGRATDTGAPSLTRMVFTFSQTEHFAYTNTRLRVPNKPHARNSDCVRSDPRVLSHSFSNPKDVNGTCVKAYGQLPHTHARTCTRARAAIRTQESACRHAGARTDELGAHALAQP